MRAVVLVSGARCWSTAPGVWKDSPVRWGQEVVGGLGGVDHVEVGVEPVGEVGYGPELGGESLGTGWLLQHRRDFCALLGVGLDALRLPAWPVCIDASRVLVPVS